MWAGEALLGWVAGEMLVSDAAVTQALGGLEHAEHWARPTAAAGALLVVTASLVLGRMRKAAG